MDKELDRMLERLRQTERMPDRLQDFETQLWQRIAAREARTPGSGLRLTLQLSAVAAAFVLGVVVGFQVPGTPARAYTLLVDDTDSLPLDRSGLLL